MACFTSRTFLDFDDYTTPAGAWQDLARVLPVHPAKICDPFCCDGTAGDLLSQAFPKAVVNHEAIDFFNRTFDEGTTIITNPTFTQKKKVFAHLKKLGLPFVVICPASTLNTQYFRELFAEEIQLVIPKKRIQFQKVGAGGQPTKSGGGCDFDCHHCCWRMNLPKDVTWVGIEKVAPKKPVPCQPIVVAAVACRNQLVHAIAERCQLDPKELMTFARSLDH